MRRVWMAMTLAAMLLLSSCGRTPTALPDVTVTVNRPSTTDAESVVTSTESGISTGTTVPSSTITTTNAATTSYTVTTTTIPSGVTSTLASTTISTTTVTTVGTIGITTTTTKPTTTTTTTTKPTTTTATTRPTVNRPAIHGEVRGAWVSYIELADILQRCATPSEAQKALDTMMQQLQECRINTVFFHVRSHSDAYYRSAVFQPATAARALIADGFDPLAYAVDAAHRRGIALHAWVNPYRVGKQAAYLVTGVPTLTDANGAKYYVPTSSKAQALILDGVREILMNYDVDGIQYDDYFYPEDLLSEQTVYGFESADYEAYQQAGGRLSVGDWRRAGVDALIAGTHTLTAAHDVVFGVSPAIDADKTYRSLYADCRKWLAQPGYVDYLCPQIYTGFEHSSSPFDAKVDEWSNYERDDTVSLYFGLALYKIGLYNDAYAGQGKNEWKNNDDVMARSVQYLYKKHADGICFYSYSYFYPTKKVGLSQTADVAVAKEEIRQLLAVL